MAINMKKNFKTLTKILVLSIFLFSNAGAAYPAYPRAIEENLELRLDCVIQQGMSGGLNFCRCRDATIKKRKEFVIRQVGAILQLRDSKEKFVIVAFAEGRLLQTFMLVNCLIWHGYNNLKVYVIGPDVHQNCEKLDCFRNYIGLICPQFSLKSYMWVQDYIADVNRGQASKGHSFDLVDVGCVINPTALHNPYIDFALLEKAMEKPSVIFELGCGSGRDVRQYRNVDEYKEQHSYHFKIQEENQ